MDSITKQNELIYTGAKEISYKIGFPKRNPKRNTKPGWKIRIEGQIKKLQQVKLEREIKRSETQRNEKVSKSQPQISLGIQLEEIDQKISAKEGRLKRCRVRQNKQNKKTKNQKNQKNNNNKKKKKQDISNYVKKVEWNWQKDDRLLQR